MIAKFQLLALTMLFLLTFGVASQAAMVMEAPGYGTDVVVRGSGALPGGYVEVFVNGVSQGSAAVGSDGSWHKDGLSLATGDKVYATLAKVWNFNTAGDTEGWTGNMVTLAVSDGALKMTIDDVTDPFMFNSNVSLASPGQYRVLQMRVKNPSTLTAFQVFFDGSGNTKGPGTPGNDKASVWPTTMTDFQTMNFDLGYVSDGSWNNISNWVADGPIYHLRVDPFRHDGVDVTDQVGQVIEFDWIRLTEYISFEFNTAGDFEGLQVATANDMSNIQIASGKLTFTAADVNADTFVDPYIQVGGLDFQFDANYYSKLDIGGNFTSAYSPANYELYWADNIWTGALQGWAENGNVIHSPSFAADGTYKEVSTDLLFATAPGTPTWGGSHSPTWYNTLRFDFFANTTAGDTAAIDYICLEPKITYGPSPVVETSSSPGEATLHLMVVNGSFEDSTPPAYPGYGNVPGWSYYATGAPGNIGINDSNGPFHDSGEIYNGDNIAFMQHAGIFSQDVPGFVSGKKYTLRYRENARAGGYGTTPPQLEARVGGSIIDAVHDVAHGSYVLREANFTAAADGINTLEFEFYEYEADQTLLFETVSIVEQGQPDPWPKNPEEPVVVTGIVTNGGFESSTYNATWPHYGTVASWDGASGVNKSDGPFQDNGTIPEGDLIGFKQGSGTMSQTVGPFTAGTQYTLRFRENARYDNGGPGGNPVDLLVRLGGAELISSHTVTGDDPEGYVFQSVDFTSPGAGNFLLEFVCETYGLDGTLLLDTISITTKGADEPFDFGPDTTDWPVNCFKVSTPPTIDGNIDVATEYPNAQVLDLRESTLTITDPYFPESVHSGSAMVDNASSSLNNDGDLSALFYFGWDNSALYVAANIRDDVLYPQTAGSITYGDCVIFALDYDQTDITEVTADGSKVFGPTFAAFTNTNNASYFEQGMPASGPNPMTGTTWAVVTTGMGYRMEARIPWTAFTAGGATFTSPFPPVDGQTIGMMPLLLDSDSEAAELGRTSMFTCGGDNFVIYNASYYQDMIFVETTAVEDWSQY